MVICTAIGVSLCWQHFVTRVRSQWLLFSYIAALVIPTVTNSFSKANMLEGMTLVALACLGIAWGSAPIRISSSSLILLAIVGSGLSIAAMILLPRVLVADRLFRQTLPGSDVFGNGDVAGVFAFAPVLAVLSAVGVLVALAFPSSVPGSSKLSWIWATLVAITVVISGSASNRVALLCAMVLFLFVRATSRQKPEWRLFLPVFIVVLSSLIFSQVSSEGIVGRSPDLTGRIPLWREIARHLNEISLFGEGRGSGWSDMGPLNKSVITTTVGWDAGQSHNSFLEAFLTGGLPAVVLLVAVLMAPPWRSRHNIQARLLSLPIAAYLALVGLFDSVLVLPGFAFLLLAWFSQFTENILRSTCFHERQSY